MLKDINILCDKSNFGCNENLLEVIKLGGFAEGINQSFALWGNMVNQLKKLCNI